MAIHTLDSWGESCVKTATYSGLDGVPSINTQASEELSKPSSRWSAQARRPIARFL